MRAVRELPSADLIQGPLGIDDILTAFKPGTLSPQSPDSDRLYLSLEGALEPWQEAVELGIILKSVASVALHEKSSPTSIESKRISRKGPLMAGMAAASILLAACAGGKPGASPSSSSVESVSPSATPTSPEFSERSIALYGRFAQDIVSSIPELQLSVVTEELESITNTVPGRVPFIAQAGEGLIPNVATGGVVQELSPIKRNSPEGGWAYISWGGGKLSFDDHSFEFPFKQDNVYLTFVIGKPNDFTPADLNTTLELSGYAAGHVYVNQATPRQGQETPGREIINPEWFSQQDWWAIFSGSNCGVGCEQTATFDFIDAYTGTDVRWILKVTSQGEGKFPKLHWVKVK